MNKTININLAGIIFHLDEDAFHKLQEYLNQLRHFFKDSEGRDEIINDIEARFAELFQEKLAKTKKEVISMNDVNESIAVMGEPEAYLEDEDAQGYQEPKGGNTSSSDFKKNRRIFRDPDDQVLGGVCSGLGAYFNVEPLIFRLLFVVMFFGFGSGLLLYILLWVIIPEASTAAEKLQMRGEDVNASNIGRLINDEVNNLKGKFEKSAADFERKAREKDFKGIVASITEGLGNLFAFIFRITFKLLGFGLVILGLFFAVSLLATLFGAGPMLFSDSYLPFNLHSLSDVIFLNAAQYTWAWVALCIFIGIPILQLLYSGIRIIFKTDPAPRGLRIGAGVFWIISVIMIFGVAVQIGMDFDRGAHYNRVIELKTDNVPGDTLHLTINEQQFENTYRDIDCSILIEGKTIFSNNIDLDVRRSPNQQSSLRIRSSARGASRAEAFDRAQNITYMVEQSGNMLKFNDYFTFDADDKWRDQEVDVILYIPEGTTIFLHEDVEDIIYDIDNVHDMWDGDMLNHYWVMRSAGLTCVDCSYYD